MAKRIIECHGCLDLVVKGDFGPLYEFYVMDTSRDLMTDVDVEHDLTEFALLTASAATTLAVSALRASNFDDAAIEEFIVQSLRECLSKKGQTDVISNIQSETVRVPIDKDSIN